MTKTKGCPYCKGGHRKKSSYNKCARRNGPKEMWPKLPHGKK